mgnify:CR=1 FL=1
MAKTTKGKTSKSSSRTLTAPLKPVEIDETIISGQNLKNDPDLSTFLRDMMLQKLFETLESKFDQLAGELGLQDWDEEDEDDDLKKILGSDNIDFNEKNIKTYRNYLQKNITLPCLLTASDDEVDWKSYDLKSKNRKIKPLKHTDVFTLVGFPEQIDRVLGVLVEVERVSDQTKYILPVGDLETVEINSKNSELLDDYLMWILDFVH